MELKTNNKIIELVFTTRKLVKVTKLLKGKTFEDMYFKAVNENDLDALSKIIFVFAEDPENGASAFKSSEDVFDFIDEYKQENKKTYDDLFKELAEAINEEGFFKTKMTKKELQEKLSNSLSTINMDEIIKNSIEKALGKVVEIEAQRTTTEE